MCDAANVGNASSSTARAALSSCADLITDVGNASSSTAPCGTEFLWKCRFGFGSDMCCGRYAPRTTCHKQRQRLADATPHSSLRTNNARCVPPCRRRACWVRAARASARSSRPVVVHGTPPHALLLPPFFHVPRLVACRAPLLSAPLPMPSQRNLRPLLRFAERPSMTLWLLSAPLRSSPLPS